MTRRKAIVIESKSSRNYKWSVEVEINRGWLRMTQAQGTPNGLQVILLSPQQARELVTAYQRLT